jgi:hypothetical protein
MFVSESSINLTGLKLRVLSAEGDIWEGQVEATTTIDAFKNLLFKYFYEETEASAFIADHFRGMK